MTGAGLRMSSRAAAAALALGLAACASAPLMVYDLTPARPPAARPLHAQFRVALPAATASLDSDRILVRDGDTLAILPGARWPQQLTTLFRARLIESFQNAGLGRSVDGGAASAAYEIGLDIRAFDFAPSAGEVHVEVAARIVSLTSGRILDIEIFSARRPVASSGATAVTAALNDASDEVMTGIVRFVARRL